MAELEQDKTADKTFGEGHALFRKIYDYSNDAIFVIDPERDEILDVNPKSCGLLGYSRGELLSLRVSAIHPREMPQLLAFARAVFEKGRGWTNELTCLTKSGSQLPAEISASVVEVAGRRCLIALVRDISERRRLEEELKRYSKNLEALVAERTQELRRSEERHRVLLEINNAIIANLDRASLFQAIVKALLEVLPFDRATLTLLDPTTENLRVQALAGASGGEYLTVGTEFPLRGSHVAPVFAGKRPLARAHLEKEPPIGIFAILQKEGIRSFVSAPLMTKGEVFGTLNLGSRGPEGYSQADADFLAEVAQQVALAVENMFAYEEIAQLKARLEEENIYLQEEIKTQHNFEEIVGQGRAISKVLKAVETVAATDASVLIMGETGTGKELIARAVHDLSLRKDKALVKVNCAALPSGLIESELFGHEKGAFTGALARKVGRFELANRGTIFLDEIGDLPLELQAKLLRVLQEGEFEKLGSSNTIEVNVRVIAATNRDLEKAVKEGKFREDLFYRLNVFPINMPSLRERKEDIPHLVRYFCKKHGTKLGKRIETVPRKVLTSLEAYSWPGNIRELENSIERALITSKGAALEFGEWLPKSDHAPAKTRTLTLEELEREYIISVLEQTGGRVSGERGAAKILNLKPSTLESRMKKLNITKTH